MEFFRQVRVDPEIGTIVWPNELDFCPDVLYHEATGTPLPIYDLQPINLDQISLSLTRQRNQILQIAASHGAYNVRIFGSVARQEADSMSDIDLLVDLEPGRSLLDLGGLLMDLQALLGQPVDVVTLKGLKQRIRQQVLREAIPL